MEMELLLDEEYDESNAILTVHAGAGGLGCGRIGRKFCLECTCGGQKGMAMKLK